ncbi:MAG: hypothetical protein M1821_006591 [Bathelium mastoideum]|nr:MAG: hypothetical protein M1821_006591 [Bathelium mastoideum]
MLFFAVGSTVFATAKSINVLIGGRFLQGLGAGGLDVLEEIILADITSLKERPLYLGFLAMPIATGTIMGPIVGAIFSEYVDWRWIGWINLPFVGIAFVLAFFFLKLRAIPMPFGDKIRRLDGIGMVLYSTGAAAIALPLSWADSLYSWGSWRTLVPLSIGLIVIAIFIWYERRPAEAIMPYRLFKSITTTASLATGFIHGLILYTMLFYLPLFFQAVFLETPLNAAKSTLPVAIVVVLFSILAPITIELTRRYRLLLWSGWISITAFLGVWIIVDRQTKRVEAYAFQALLGIGVGVVFTGTQVPVQASVAHVDDVGLAVGMLVVFRLLGALIGQAAASTLFNTIFSKSIKDLGVLPDALTILEDASQAVGFIPALRTLDIDERTFDRVIGVYMKSFRAIWIFVTVWAAVGIFCSLFIKELALESEETGRQGFVTLENINEERV